jgi:hypothetical protein
MTFRSLTIERHETRESAQAPYRVDHSYHLIFSLNAFTFPKSLHSFAAEQDLPLSYVDNAWLRVAMDGRALKQFLDLGRRTEIGLDSQLQLIEDQRWFVVTEEEF